MPLEALEDEDEAWVCDYCCSLAEALSLIVEVDADVDRDTVPELIEALRAASTNDSTGVVAGRAGAGDEDDMALLRKMAIAVASGQPATPDEAKDGAGGRRRHAIDYAMLNALMYGDGASALDEDDVEYRSEGDETDDDDEDVDLHDDDDDAAGDLGAETIADAGAAAAGRRPTRRAAVAARSQIRMELERMERARMAKAAAGSASGADGVVVEAAVDLATSGADTLADEDNDEDDESFEGDDSAA